MRGLAPRLPAPAWIVLGADLLSAAGSGLTAPFLIVYLHRERGIDLTVASLVLASLAVASIVGNVAGGWLADRAGARRTLALGLLCSAAGAGALAVAASVPSAFGAAAVLGLGNSIAWPALDSLLATAVEGRERSAAFALRHATLNLGFGAGAILAAVVVRPSSLGSFQLLYALDAATFAAAAVAVAAIRVGDRVAREDDAPGTWRTVLADRTFLTAWGLAALLVGFGYAQYEAALPPFATRTGGISPHLLGWVFATNTLAVASLQLVVLRLVEGRRRTSALAAAAASFGCAWCIVVVGGHTHGYSAVATFAIAMAVLALGETLVSPSLGPMVNDLAPDDLRGRYNGAFVLAYTTGFILGPALAGGGLRIGDGGAWFAILAAACFAGVPWAFALRRRLPSRVDLIGERRPGAVAAPEPV
jgi:MFS family permease